MNGRMVLFIDGPLKGKLAECNNQPPMYFEEDPLRGEGVFPPLFSERPEPKRYYFYQLTIFGRVIWAGSVKEDAGVDGFASSMDALWDLVVSSAAKQAEQPR